MMTDNGCSTWTIISNASELFVNFGNFKGGAYPNSRNSRIKVYAPLKIVTVVVTFVVSMIWYVSAGSGSALQAQEKPLMAEDVFKNVQVLKGIPVNQFMETMGFFSAALGYNCTNCHGTAVLGNWDKYANETPEKMMARRMIQVVNTINKDLFGG